MFSYPYLSGDLSPLKYQIKLLIKKKKVFEIVLGKIKDFQ